MDDPARVPGGRNGPLTTLPRPVVRLVVWSAGFVVVTVAGYLLGRITVRLAPLALALAATVFLAALLDPVRSGLRRLRLPAALVAVLTVLLLLVAVVVPVLLAWQRGMSQVAELTRQLGTGLQRLRDMLTAPGSPIDEAQLDDLIGQGMSRVQGLLPSPVAGARAAVEVLAVMALVLVLLFFVLKDGPRLWRRFVDRGDGIDRRTVAVAGEAAWDTLTGYARGTMLIALLDALGIGLALVLLDVPMALVLALITFLGGFVPIIGATLAGAFAVLVALAAQGPGTALLAAAAVVAVQQIEGNLLQPLIMKHQVKLHPVVTLVAVTAGTLTGGFAGAFVAVPLTAVTYRVVTVVHRSRRPPPVTTSPSTAAADGPSTNRRGAAAPSG